MSRAGVLMRSFSISPGHLFIYYNFNISGSVLVYDVLIMFNKCNGYKYLKSSVDQPNNGTSTAPIFLNIFYIYILLDLFSTILKYVFYAYNTGLMQKQFSPSDFQP